MKKYVVITTIEGEHDMHIKTEKELAELWENNQIAGYIDDISAYDYIDGKMTKVSVYDIATAYLSEREAIQREYEEYTEYVNEYGYDYRDEM